LNFIKQKYSAFESYKTRFLLNIIKILILFSDSYLPRRQAGTKLIVFCYKVNVLGFIHQRHKNPELLKA